MFPAYYFINGKPIRIKDSKKWPPMPRLYSLAEGLAALNVIKVLTSDEIEGVAEPDRVSENQIVLGNVQL